MGFQYIDKVITPENLQKFLELVDKAAGAGKDVNNVFDLSDRLKGTRPMSICVKAIEQDPASRAMLEERYAGPPYNLEAMLNMPKGSLGWTYGRIMSTLGYNPQFYRTPPSFENPEDYIIFRVYKTHDLHHILTGFSLDNFGELGVISVFGGQIGFPAFVFLDLLSMMMAFFANDGLYSEVEDPIEQARTLGYRFRLISDGIEMGMKAKPLFPVKWEEMLEHSLDELRAEFQIEPATEGIYSWYSDPRLRSAIT
ncbi:Coq4 family protein [Synechocystis sp. LKSZ1]|uniref:Coq4 family protein n=1 Tax=Synechocystis sp. LKSZ1 TaxID=3144951 RepID=UPI00336C1CBE